jgi:hypothetical protein
MPMTTNRQLKQPQAIPAFEYLILHKFKHDLLLTSNQVRKQSNFSHFFNFLEVDKLWVTKKTNVVKLVRSQLVNDLVLQN